MLLGKKKSTKGVYVLSLRWFVNFGLFISFKFFEPKRDFAGAVFNKAFLDIPD